MVAGRLLGDCWEVIKRLLGCLSRLFFEHLQISEGWEVIGRIIKRTLGGESGFFKSWRLGSYWEVVERLLS